MRSLFWFQKKQLQNKKALKFFYLFLSLPFNEMTSQPSYNHLPTTLKNRYIIQRHGFSLANNAGLICSNPDIAIPPTGGPLNTGYGLHEKGKAQVKEVHSKYTL